MDFAQKYLGVVHFGLWAEEGADGLGNRDAFNILKDAAKRAYSEDVRSDSLDQALAYLERYAVRKRPFEDFRKALKAEDPVQRVKAMYDAMHRITKEV